MSDHDKSLLQGLASEGRPSGRYALELSSGLTDLTVTRIGRNNSPMLPLSPSMIIRSVGRNLTARFLRARRNYNAPVSARAIASPACC